MNATLWLARYRLRAAVRTPTALFIQFGLPVILLALTGLLFFHGHPFERRTLVITGAHTAAAERSLRRFGDLRIETGGAASVALRRLRVGVVRAVLVTDGEGARVHVAPRDELMGVGLRAALGGDTALRIEPVGERAYLHYLFPGMVVWTLLVNGLLGMGTSMAHYRNTRFLKKLRTTPLSRYSFVASQIVARGTLSLVQLAWMAVIAWALFGLRLGLTEALWASALVALGVVVFAGVGFALAAAVRDESSVSDAANALTAVLLLVSEVFFPVDDLPRPIAWLAGVLPSTQLVRALRAVMLWGETDAMKVLPSLALLGAWGAAAYLLSVLTFRWEE